MRDDLGGSRDRAVDDEVPDPVPVRAAPPPVAGPTREAFDIPEWVSEVRRLYVEPKTEAMQRDEGAGARGRRLAAIRSLRRTGPSPDGQSDRRLRPAVSDEPEGLSPERLAAIMGPPAATPRVAATAPTDGNALTPELTPWPQTTGPAAAVDDEPVAVNTRPDAAAQPVDPTPSGRTPVAERPAVAVEPVPEGTGADQPAPGHRVHLSWREAEALDLGAPAAHPAHEAIVLKPPSQPVDGSRGRSQRRHGQPAGGHDADEAAIWAPSAQAVEQEAVAPRPTPVLPPRDGGADAGAPLAATATRSAARAAARAAAERRFRVRRLVALGVLLLVVALLVGWLLMRGAGSGSAAPARSATPGPALVEAAGPTR